MLILLNRSIFDLDIKKLTEGIFHTRIDFKGYISLTLSLSLSFSLGAKILY